MAPAASSEACIACTGGLQADSVQQHGRCHSWHVWHSNRRGLEAYRTVFTCHSTDSVCEEMKSTPKSCMKGSRSCGPRPSSGFRHRAASCTCGRGARLQLKFDSQVYASSFAVYFSRAPAPDTIPGKMVSLVGHAKRNLGHTTVRSALLFFKLPST